VEERRDIVDIDGVIPKASSSSDPQAASQHKPFLSVWFRCCHSYGRMYRNKDGTQYEGRCPKCGAGVHALIGAHGTARRTFIAE
jgi:hypothetical protein